jgi:hypothetical protein
MLAGVLIFDLKSALMAERAVQLLVAATIANQRLVY